MDCVLKDGTKCGDKVCGSCIINYPGWEIDRFGWEEYRKMAGLPTALEELQKIFEDIEKEKLGLKLMR